MENTNKKRYWLKGGALFLILSLIIGFVGFLVTLGFSQPFSGMGANIVIFPVKFITAPLSALLHGGYPNTIGDQSFRLTTIVLTPLAWFVIGAIIGWIYGKIKNRKSSASSSTV